MKSGFTLSLAIFSLLLAFGDAPAQKSGPGLLQLRGHYNAVDALRFTTDGKYFLSHSSRGRTVILWSIAHRRVVGRLRHRDLERAALMPRSRGAVSMGNLIRVWDVRTGAVMRSFPLPKDPELYPLKSENIQVTPDEQYLVYHSYAALNFFDLHKGRPAFRIKKERPGAGGSLLFHPSGRSLFLLNDGGANTISVWSVPRRRKTTTLKTPRRLSCFALGAGGEVLVAGARGGSILVWRRSVSGPPTELFLPDRFAPNLVSVGPRGRFAAAASGSGVFLFDLRQKRRAPIRKTAGYLRAMTMNASLQGMIGSGPRGELFMWPFSVRERGLRWESALKRMARGNTTR